MHKSQAYIFVAILILIAVFLQGCTTQPPDRSTQAAISPAATSASVAVTSETQSASQTASIVPVMANTTTSASVAPTSLIVPTHTPNLSSGYIVNDFSASDDKYIYYLDGGWFSQMDKTGGNNREIGIKNCYQLLTVNSTSIYFLVYDYKYVPTKNEEGWQGDYSFNLMVYDKKTRKAKTIQKHFVDAIEANGKIYMIDHMNHTHIFSYDILKNRFADVSGFTERFTDNDSMNFEKVDGKLYLFTNMVDSSNNDIIYMLYGNIAKKSTSPYLVEEPSQNKDFVYIDDNRVAFIWTGNEYKDLGLQDAWDVFETGSKFYVITENWNVVSDDNNRIKIALYEILPDGQTRKIIEKTDEQGGVGIKNEMVDGWIFSFWKEWDGGSWGLILNQKVG